MLKHMPVIWWSLPFSFTASLYR